jgi:hypothetical protein
MPNGIRLRVFGQITDPGGQGDFATQQVRGILVGPINNVALPYRGAVTQLDATFWSNSELKRECRFRSPRARSPMG